MTEMPFEHENESTHDAYLKFLIRLCELRVLLIPQLRYEEICDQSLASSLTVDLLHAATCESELVTQLYRHGVTDWSVLVGMYSDLNILNTRSKKAAERIAKHPMTTRMRYWSPDHGFVFLFRDWNRRRIEFLAKDERRAVAVVERIIAGGKKEVSITHNGKQQVRLTMPPLSITSGRMDGESFYIYQGEAAAFDLPSPADLARCQGLDAALRLARTDWQVFDADRLLQFSVQTTSF